MPGVLALEGPRCEPRPSLSDNPQSEIRNPQSFSAHEIERFCTALPPDNPIRRFRWIIVADDSQFVTESLRNFLWVTFTRVNPAADIHGIDSFVHNKHWGCRGPLVFDARIKPHHAPPLVDDPDVARRVDALAAPGGPLHGIF
jgi:4-hydroxy-3-polyprenylbenzoate decarboxylase